MSVTSIKIEKRVREGVAEGWEEEWKSEMGGDVMMTDMNFLSLKDNVTMCH